MVLFHNFATVQEVSCGKTTLPNPRLHHLFSTRAFSCAGSSAWHAAHRCASRPACTLHNTGRRNDRAASSSCNAQLPAVCSSACWNLQILCPSRLLLDLAGAWKLGGSCGFGGHQGREAEHARRAPGAGQAHEFEGLWWR